MNNKLTHRCRSIAPSIQLWNQTFWVAVQLCSYISVSVFAWQSFLYRSSTVICIVICLPWCAYHLADNMFSRTKELSMLFFCFSVREEGVVKSCKPNIGNLLWWPLAYFSPRVQSCLVLHQAAVKQPPMIHSAQRVSHCDDVFNLHAVCLCWISVANPQWERESADLGCGNAAHCITLTVSLKDRIQRLVSHKEYSQTFCF